MPGGSGLPSFHAVRRISSRLAPLSRVTATASRVACGGSQPLSDLIPCRPVSGDRPFAQRTRCRGGSAVRCQRSFPGQDSRHSSRVIGQDSRLNLDGVCARGIVGVVRRHLAYCRRAQNLLGLGSLARLNIGAICLCHVAVITSGAHSHSRLNPSPTMLHLH